MAKGGLSYDRKEKFERHLRFTNLSENTISSYMFAIKQYGEQYDDVTQKVCAVQGMADREYKPKTVNLRLRAINCYLECIVRRNGNCHLSVFSENFSGKCNQQKQTTNTSNPSEKDDEMFCCFVMLHRPPEQSERTDSIRLNTSSWGISTYTQG